MCEREREREMERERENEGERESVSVHHCNSITFVSYGHSWFDFDRHYIMKLCKKLKGIARCAEEQTEEEQEKE